LRKRHPEAEPINIFSTVVERVIPQVRLPRPPAIVSEAAQTTATMARAGAFVVKESLLMAAEIAKQARAERQVRLAAWRDLQMETMLAAQQESELMAVVDPQRPITFATTGAGRLASSEDEVTFWHKITGLSYLQPDEASKPQWVLIDHAEAPYGDTEIQIWTGFSRPQVSETAFLGLSPPRFDSEVLSFIAESLREQRIASASYIG